MLDISARTIQVGLIGSGIQLSRSPALHVAEGRANGLSLSYELIDLDMRRVGLSASPLCYGRSRNAALPASMSPIPPSRRSWPSSTSCRLKPRRWAPSTPWF